MDHNKLWKILQEMGIPDPLTCLLRNLACASSSLAFCVMYYAGQEGTVRTGHGTIDLFQIGKGVRQGCILSPCLFNLYSEYIMSTPQFKRINSLALSFLHSPTLTSIHDHRKNHSLDETNLCWQSNVSAFQYAI